MTTSRKMEKWISVSQAKMETWKPRFKTTEMATLIHLGLFY